MKKVWKQYTYSKHRIRKKYGKDLNSHYTNNDTYFWNEKVTLRGRKKKDKRHGETIISLNMQKKAINSPNDRYTKQGRAMREIR